MSLRLATLTRTKRWAGARIARAVLCGWLVVSAGTLAAQPSQSDDVNKVDRNNPVPADAPGRRSHAKFAIPNTDRLIFNQIEDFKPVAAESVNPGEYAAWCEFVTHAKQFPTAELESHAARDLTPVDLLKPQRSVFRCELLRFDGQLECVRRLAAPLFFENNPQLGVTELYEARLVPVDESPLTPVSIVFTELPAALEFVRTKPTGEWADATGWVTAAGYYFKTMNVPGEQANAVVGVPVLIGKSVTPTDGPPVPAGDDPTALDPNVRVYKFIKDDAAMIRNSPTESSWPEVAAQNRVLLHAARFSAEELERHALTDVKFADLFQEIRADYKLKNVKIEGRLISLRRVEVNKELRAAGVEQVFEGWLVPANEPRGNPVCVYFTEPLPGVEPTGRVNVWVSFAGYSFKLMRYESAEMYEDDPNRHKVKRAPLLIGKRPIQRRDPDGPTAVTWGMFVEGAVILAALLIVAGGGLALYYRRSDRPAKDAMGAVRGRNPFDPANASPPA